MSVYSNHVEPSLENWWAAQGYFRPATEEDWQEYRRWSEGLDAGVPVPVPAPPGVPLEEPRHE
jgi:hypothetical protein